MKKIPKRLYKYLSFSNRTLDLIIADEIHFSDPSTFNDPLDTKPLLEIDIDAESLAVIFEQLVKRRFAAENSAVAKTVKFRDPKTKDQIAYLSQKHAEQLIAEIRYNATNPECEMEDPTHFLFGQYVRNEILRRYGKGIFSLAERPNCPLMWSHYGEQHNGLCVGYSVPERALGSVYKVKYGGSRQIKASLILSMLEGDENARKEVDEAVLAKKAADWQYEREWRLVGSRGLQECPLELEEVVFGMRCPMTVKYAVVKALENRSRIIKFYEIRELQGRFCLEKITLCTGELLASLPRRALDIHDDFNPVAKDL